MQINIYDLDSKVSAKLLKYYLPFKYSSIVKEVSIASISMLYHLNIDSSLNAYRFDYLDIKSKTIIEFDGDQHFQETQFYGGHVGFQTLREADLIKQKFVVDYDFHLIRIKSGVTLRQLDELIDQYQVELVDEKKHLFIMHDEHLLVKHDQINTMTKSNDQSTIHNTDLQSQVQSVKHKRLGVNRSNDVSSWMDERFHLVEGINRISIASLYQDFVVYCLENNIPKSKIKQRRSFTNELSRICTRYGYILSETQSRFSESRDTLDNMYRVVNHRLNTDRSSTHSRSIEKIADRITQQEINQFQKMLSTLEIQSISNRQLLILMYLASCGNDLALEIVSQIETSYQ